MHLRQSLERAVSQKQHEKEFASKLLKEKSPVIGSVNNGRLNYSKEDIPTKTLEIKNAVKDFVDADLLGLKSPQWNQSNIGSKFFDGFIESQQEKLMKIRMGFYDLSAEVKKQRSRKQYSGTDSRNDYSGWNVSRQLDSKTVMNKRLLEKTLKSVNNSLQQSRVFDNYEKLEQRYQRTRREDKERDQEDDQLKRSLASSFMEDNRNASPERINASTIKLLRQSRINRQKSKYQGDSTSESFTNFKSALTPSQRGKIQQNKFHSGIWFTVPRQQAMAWTCCLNEEQESEGCCIKKLDGNKSNYISYDS